ncbi:MAG TPA: glycosyl hydrolase family 28-related protein [Gemmatimonadales bacterium]|nr:glycosyl hydrolase family 28-related protein [Gemmatimonadales bacterium]
MRRRSLLGWLAAGIPLRIPGAEDAWGVSPAAADHDAATNVREYGAAGDGVRDDTRAIQQAIDVSRDGKPVLFPAGRYRIRKTVTVHDDCVLVGWGRHSILQCSEPDTDALVCEGVKKVFIEGLAIDGDGSNRDGLVVRQADDVRIRRCWIKSMGGRALTIVNTPCGVVDSDFELCGGDGIFVSETNSGEPPHIITCSVYHNGGHGLHFTSNANQAMIQGCEIILNAGSGILIENASKMISVVGNSILGNGIYGIEIATGSPWNAIVSNVLSENGLAGIAIRNHAHDTVVMANRFLDNCRSSQAEQAELLVRNSTRILALGNIFARMPRRDPAPPHSAILADPGAISNSLNAFDGLAQGSPVQPGS